MLLSDQLEIIGKDATSQFIRGLHEVLSVDDIVMINLSWLKATAALLTISSDRPQSKSVPRSHPE